jgi:hypothetical protein
MLNAAGERYVRDVLLRLPLGQYLELQRMAAEACAPGLSPALQRKKTEETRLTILTRTSQLGLDPMQDSLLASVFGSPTVLSLEKERHA